MATYKIMNVYTGGALQIYGSNLTSLSNNINVWNNGLGDDSLGRWVVDNLGTGVYVRSRFDTAFGLNVYRSGDPFNCDIHVINGNETDAQVNFMYHSATGFYMIKLTNYNLYLTGSTRSSQKNVYWGNYIGESSHLQMWRVVQVDSDPPAPTPTKLSMLQNKNQRYVDNDQCIQESGCMVCCVCDVASYYRGAEYSLNDMKNYGVYSEYSPYCVYSRAPSANFNNYSGYTQSDYYTKIRSEINNGRPVLVHMVGTISDSHWVVAYGYDGNGESSSEIFVLDPYGIGIGTLSGRNIKLCEALGDQGASSIDYLMTTSRK